MSITNKNILLACFDFPPNQGIGGRRWAKFAYQLAEFGYNVHVIKAEPLGGNKSSAWTKDVDHKNIHTYSLARNYPEIISNPGKSILSKIQYKFQLQKLKSKYRGTIYDRALGWEKAFSSKAKELIKEFNIENVLATGAPFNLVYYTAKLKTEFPKLNVIVDYRDPWITAKNYGMSGLEETRMNYELEKQSSVFRLANVVTCPNEFLLKEIKDSNSQKEIVNAKFIALPHFFDSREVKHYLKPELKSDEKIRFVYGGVLYLGLDEYLNKLANYLDHLKKTSPDLYSRCEFNFFTESQNKKALFSSHEEIVKFHQPVGKDIFHHINSADYVMIFLAEHNKDFKTTKFFEYLPFKKPIIYFGPKGEVAKFITQDNLGYSIQNYDIDFENLFKDVEENKSEFKTDYDESVHSLENVTKKLCTLLK